MLLPDSQGVEPALRDFLERRLGSDISTFTERELPEVFARLDRNVADNVLYARVARLVLQMGLVEDGTLFERLRKEFASAVVHEEIDGLAELFVPAADHNVLSTTAAARSSPISKKYKVSMGWGCLTVVVIIGTASAAAYRYIGYLHQPRELTPMTPHMVAHAESHSLVTGYRKTSVEGDSSDEQAKPFPFSRSSSPQSDESRAIMIKASLYKKMRERRASEGELRRLQTLCIEQKDQPCINITTRILCRDPQINCGEGDL